MATNLPACVLGLVVLLPLPAWGCASSVSRSIDEVNAALTRLVAADNAGDVDAIASFYTEDAVLLPPAGEPVHGRDAIRRSYEGGLKRFELDVRIRAVRTEAPAPDWAMSRGTTSGRYVWRDGSPPTPFHHKYLAILRRERGGPWRVSTLMWNESAPGP